MYRDTFTVGKAKFRLAIRANGNFTVQFASVPASSDRVPFVRGTLGRGGIYNMRIQGTVGGKDMPSIGKAKKTK